MLFVTLASWAGYELFQRPTLNQGAAVSRPPWAIWKSPFLVFYLALALGFLAKGPIAWTPLLTVVVVIIYARDWELFRRFKFVGGILLMLVVVALWGIPALIQRMGSFSQWESDDMSSPVRLRHWKVTARVPSGCTRCYCRFILSRSSSVSFRGRSVAAVDSKIVAEKRSQGRLPSPRLRRTSRPRLQRNSD